MVFAGRLLRNGLFSRPALPRALKYRFFLYPCRNMAAHDNIIYLRRLDNFDVKATILLSFIAIRRLRSILFHDLLFDRTQANTNDKRHSQVLIYHIVPAPFRRLSASRQP